MRHFTQGTLFFNSFNSIRSLRHIPRVNILLNYRANTGTLRRVHLLRLIFGQDYTKSFLRLFFTGMNFATCFFLFLTSLIRGDPVSFLFNMTSRRGTILNRRHVLRTHFMHIGGNSRPWLVRIIMIIIIQVPISFFRAVVSSAHMRITRLNNNFVNTSSFFRVRNITSMYDK